MSDIGAEAGPIHGAQATTACAASKQPSAPAASHAPVEETAAHDFLKWSGAIFLVHLLLIVVLASRLTGPVTAKALSNTVNFGVTLIAGLWCLIPLRDRAFTPKSRGSLFLAALGMLSYTAGMLVWMYYQYLRGVEVPYPSGADFFFLTSYPLLVVSLLLLPFRLIPAAQRVRIFLDGLLIVAGSWTFLWYFRLGPALHSWEGTAAAKIISIAYPLQGILQIACLIIIGNFRADPKQLPALRTVFFGMIACMVGDTVYANQLANGIYQSGAWLDACWPLGYALIALGMRDICARLSSHVQSQSGDEESCTQHRADQSPARAFLPYLLLLASCALAAYTWRNPHDGYLRSGVFCGAGAAVVLVVARQIFIILENGRLYRSLQATVNSLARANKQLESLAMTDGVTGLTNHRCFQDRLAEEYRRCVRYSRDLSLIMLDVDKFKQFNDTFGHPAGDHVLKTVAKILTDNARSTDIVARYGGEEFVIILPEMSEEGARAVAERMRQQIESAEWPERPITASLGIATACPEIASHSELTTAADQALYRAKQRGRNRTVHAREINLEYATLGKDPYAELMQTMLEVEHTELQSAGEHLRQVIQSSFEATVEAWSRMLDLRDPDSQGHRVRVAQLVAKLARTVGMTEEEVLYVRWGALLHDIGNAGHPGAISEPRGTFTECDGRNVRSHATLAHDLLWPIPFLRPAVEIPYCLHERWDGKGSPRGLKGDDVPIASLLFSVVQAWDTLTHDRSYRGAYSPDEARAVLEKGSGTQFDPRAVRAFFAMLDDDSDEMLIESAA